MKRTPIPREGWTEADIGREVVIKMPHGTLMPDVIVFINIPAGETIIGPSLELGAIAARSQFSVPLIQENDAYIMSMEDDTLAHGEQDQPTEGEEE